MPGDGSPVHVRRHKGYLIGSAQELAAESVAEILQALKLRPQIERRPLRGRGYVSLAVLAGFGRVVVKHYKRGGVLRFLNRGRYLRFASLRPQIEFELLERVRSLGVQSPEPVAFIVQGRLLYRGWLITKKIENEQTLAEISRTDDERLIAAMHSLAAQVSILIRNGIYHVDFHPGNVLVNKDGVVYILDFDKARCFEGPKNMLRDRYLCRWRRAVIKHKLPELLSELLCAELRKKI